MRIVVVGAGLAGLTAALMCIEAGTKVEVVAQGQGALTLHPGWIETGDVEALAQQADHPYAKAGELLSAGLAQIDAVVGLRSANQVVTALGSLRQIAFTVGSSYAPLVKPLIVGFDGWRDFYAGMISDNLCRAGIDAASINIAMPDLGGNFDNWTVDLANYLDTPEGMTRLIVQVKPKLEGALSAGFPAVLGFKPETRQKISEALNVPVFEIPTLTPSVPGLRLYHALRRAIIDRGGRLTIGPKVAGLARNGQRMVTGVLAETAAHGRHRSIPADAVILATGGLFGGGLESNYQGKVWETVANLHVANVPPLGDWFPNPLLSDQPQPIHRAGVLTDGDLRPLDANGTVIAPNLYAAGRILGGYSPVIEGSTEGVDIATGAHAAIKGLAVV